MLASLTLHTIPLRHEFNHSAMVKLKSKVKPASE